MRSSKLLMCAGVLLLASGHARAALWSSGNATGSAGGTTTMTVSFTGDGRTMDAGVDIAIPTGFTATVTALNGASCVVFAATTIRPAVVRVITPVSTVPLPQSSTSLCRITLAVTAFAESGRFAMFHDVCAAADAVSSRCELDPGYFTVRL